jgi:hypothetical protein
MLVSRQFCQGFTVSSEFLAQFGLVCANLGGERFNVDDTAITLRYQVCDAVFRSNRECLTLHEPRRDAHESWRWIHDEFLDLANGCKDLRLRLVGSVARHWHARGRLLDAVRRGAAPFGDQDLRGGPQTFDCAPQLRRSRGHVHDVIRR